MVHRSQESEVRRGKEDGALRLYFFRFCFFRLSVFEILTSDF